MPDLFPETLLVSRSGEHIYTTSRKVAEHFGKRHDNVLRDVQKLLAELTDAEFGRLNFEESSYLNEQLKQQPEYRLTEEGFALLAMGFTGREALRWKVAFLQAFRAMESDLADMQARYVAALDLVRPSLRPTVEDARAGLPRAVTAQRLGKSVGAVSYHRSQGSGLGLLPAVAVRRMAAPDA